MHFLRARFLEAVHTLLAGGAAYDRVVHNNHALVLHQIGDEIQLHAHIKIPDELARLQKAATHIMVAHKRHLKWDAALQ